MSVPPSFAAKWFAPRMASFLKRYPDLALDLTTSTAFVDFELDGVDLAIRYFNGEDPTLTVEKLCTDEAHVYGAPDYMKRLKIRHPDDVRKATLLHNTLHPHWSPWLGKFSRLSAEQIASIPGIQFDRSLIAIDAAVRGQGLIDEAHTALRRASSTSRKALYSKAAKRLRYFLGQTRILKKCGMHVVIP